MKTFIVTFRNKKTREEIEVMYVENSFDKVYKLAKLPIKKTIYKSI